MELRRYRSSDLAMMSILFYETINEVNSNDYNQEQCLAWAPDQKVLLDRDQFFSSLYTVVAVSDHLIVGYGNIDDTGYLDHLFVHKDYQGAHIASMICDD